VCWIHLAHDTIQWRAVANSDNPSGSIKVKQFDPMFYAALVSIPPTVFLFEDPAERTFVTNMEIVDEAGTRTPRHYTIYMTSFSHNSPFSIYIH
jgi:hypothetical protein